MDGTAEPIDFNEFRARFGDDAAQSQVDAAEYVRADDVDHAPVRDTTADYLPLLDLSEWAGRTPEPQEWALADWMPLRQATYLTGPGSAGKSLLSQLLCTCSALGLPFLGIDTRQAPALYVTCEDDPATLERRQKAICEGLGVDRNSVVGKLHLVSLQGEIDNELVQFDQSGRMIVTGAYRRLEATAKMIGAGMVILDNASHLTPEEIQRNKVAGFVNLLNRLAIAIDGAVLLLGHPNKNGDPYSGSTAWENQVRSRLYMETEKDKDGGAIDPDVRVLSRQKSNYARNGESITFRWFQGSFVRDEDLPPNMAAEIASVAADNAHNDRFLACLAERTRQQRAVSEKRSPSFAPTVFAAMPEAKGSNKRDLERAMDRLFRLGKIERAELWKGDDRKAVFGLREVAGNGLRETQKMAENLAGNGAGNGAGNMRETMLGIEAGNGAGNAGNTHPYTTYKPGAAFGARAPGDQYRSSPILAPGDEDDEPFSRPPAGANGRTRF